MHYRIALKNSNENIWGSRSQVEVKKILKISILMSNISETTRDIEVIFHSRTAWYMNIDLEVNFQDQFKVVGLIT